MIPVVRQFIPGFRVHEYHQSLAVQRQPRQNHPYHFRPERQLATPVRVWPNRLLMHAPHRHGKQPRRLLAQFTGLLHGRCVVINVGVVTLDPLHDNS